MFIQHYLSIIILFLTFNYTQQYQMVDSGSLPDKNNLYDIIILAQHWPVTSCKLWKQNDSQNRCAFPIIKDRWTLHGIWPLKANKSGPSYCNDSWPFDMKEVESIRTDLEQAWTNVYEGSEPDDLWRHEWNKHGTCGTDLEAFNTQLKYFSKGIEWNLEYSLANMLGAARLYPSDTRPVIPEELRRAVRNKTNKQPMIVCASVDGVQYLDELRICFDKKLTIIDCDPFIFHTCDLSKDIIYPTRH